MNSDPIGRILKREDFYDGAVTEYKANLVVMMLGTNDTTEENWTDIDTVSFQYKNNKELSIPFF